MIEELRRFIRHPSSVPIQVKLGEQHQQRSLKDVSKGGLCFCSAEPIAVGTLVEINILACKPGFTAKGIISWCKPEGNQYLVGVNFQSKAMTYALRMVEQICYIEDYRKRISANTGRQLTSDQAALEWIQKYAADFPRLNE
ncbi:MAG TPA: PilZ domain-containing protein [Methylophaga aminisulfidivorans]|jgi:PilZ domain-containing protein|uniref:PilZ domain-containing protein n=1 Tax=Methylophaga TaxID=40222 RepID=UPI00175625FA|nr:MULTISPECIES: PilZ domain-containing protein [Methylophaga]HIC45929.1 PilZ domain-containing protein [Methylophaga sp.]HIM39705.1 PilZ domain-containing protein [Methylophaga aminisulfidivorans]